MNFFSNSADWDNFLKIFSDEETYQGKGECFESLVQKILLKLFIKQNINFKATKITHDGSKDFWAIDEEQKRWWAECKNHTSNLSMKTLSPTLLMAELYEIDYLLFFSYSKLNDNLLRKIGLYSNKHNKRVFIYDDIVLENIIVSLFPDETKAFLGFLPDITNHSPVVSTFYEKNPLLFNANNFNGYYNVDKLITGEVYNINTIVLNRSQQAFNIIAGIKRNKDLTYFHMLSNSKDTYELLGFELVLFSYKVQVSKYKDKLAFPKVDILFDNKIINCNSSNGKACKYSCENGHRSLLVGEHYENIKNTATDICTRDSMSGFLIYGHGGTGKTRILHECYLGLLQSNYKVLNFTNFDSDSNWKDVVKEITYNIFAIDDDMVLDIMCNIQNEEPFYEVYNSFTNEEKNVYNFFKTLNTNNDTESLIGFYEIIYEKMRKGKYAIIIDNFQSYPSELVEFFENMFNYYTNCNRYVDISLLFSINIDLIFDNSFSSFISKFIAMKNNNISSSFYCEEIEGFINYEQAMVFLYSKLHLEEFAQHERIKTMIERNAGLKPKYIEQIAEYIIKKGCIVIHDKIGYVPDTANLEKCLCEVSSDYHTLFCYNYNKILEKNNDYLDEFKLIFSIIYLFGAIEEKHIEVFCLSNNALDILQHHGIICNNGSTSFHKYTVEHDLSLECLTTKVYIDLLSVISDKITKLDVCAIKRLSVSNSYLLLCRLACKNISFSELETVDVFMIEELHNRHKFSFAEHLLNSCIIHISDYNSILISKVNQICKYINDHIGVPQAEKLFITAYNRICLIQCTDSSMLSELFSFYIHMAENKMHMSKSKDVLELYKQLRKTMQKIRLIREIDYAEAYILNRRFVCGKIEGDVLKYSSDLCKSKEMCRKYGFWDIQFENYFDESNIYKSSQNKESLLHCLDNGFNAFRKTTLAQKRKYMPNFLSKKIQYLCINNEFSKALLTANKALEFIDENREINYHLFFKKRYLKYKFISLVALNKTQFLGDVLQELSIVHALSGNTDTFEILYYNFIYHYILNETNKMIYYYEEMYHIAESRYNGNLDCGFILKDLGLKLRLILGDKMELSFVINEQNKTLFPANEVLTSDSNKLIKIMKEFVSPAIIYDEEKAIGFYY